jgi:hypothetical protein
MQKQIALKLCLLTIIQEPEGKVTEEGLISDPKSNCKFCKIKNRDKPNHVFAVPVAKNNSKKGQLID